MNKVFEIEVLGFGGENEVVKEVFSFRNKVYLLSRCYFIILNIKFIIWYRLLKISNNYAIPISLSLSLSHTHTHTHISKESPLNSRKLRIRINYKI